MSLYNTDTIPTLLQNVRDCVIAAYTAAVGQVTGLTIPAAVLMPTGPLPVIDCGDLLIVHCPVATAAFQGTPEQCAIVMQATIEVTVTRCIPNLTDWGTPDTRANLTEAGLLLARDASLLFYSLAQACQQGTLWSGFTDLGCADTKFRDMRPGASGGIGWWKLDLVVNVTDPT